jgi:ABC-type Na+ efflux pump permease subunit
MSLLPFLRRELTTSVRNGRALIDRQVAVIIMAMVVAGCLVAWDWRGMDRNSLTGAASFGLAVFGCLVAAQVILSITGAFLQLAPSIATERDQKSLDSLLMTPFSSAEIVLGIMASAFVRHVNGLAATLPVVALLVILGGIAPWLALLAGMGLIATWYAAAALSLAASVVSPTRTHAHSLGVAMILLWLIFPPVFLLTRPLYWPGCPSLFVEVAIAFLRSSPMGVMFNLGGIVRFGGLVDALWRMVAGELIGGSALIAWSIWRLRPASRALHDAEGQRARNRVVRLVRAARRRRPRPPCGEDPVLWYARHGNRPTRVQWVERQLIGLAGIASLAVVTYWFAGPALMELASSGYGTHTGDVSMPQLNPLARVLFNRLSGTVVLNPAPGQARLEFNLAMRQLAILLAMPFAFGIVAAAARSVEDERKRDTWLGLIATPLSGWEIIRAKMLGAILHARGYLLTMIALWTIGLLSGALHPVGYLAGLVELAVTAAFFAAAGVAASLWGRDRKEVDHRIGWPLRVLIPIVWCFLLPVSPSVLAWTSLVSYEDIYSASHRGVFLSMTWWPALSGISAATVIFCWLIATAAMGVVAFFLIRTMTRDFDAIVGRPTLPGADGAP